VDVLNLVNCPVCKTQHRAEVTDSRPRLIGSAFTVRRRKKCAGCGHRFSTVEVPAEMADDLFNDE
jgi:transcriptional regulator NrdR family protein